VVVRTAVVGVGAAVGGVVPSGTNTDDGGAVFGAAVDPDDCAPEVPAVLFVAFFFFLVDGKAFRVVDVVTDAASDERVGRESELARSLPLEHAAANIVNATVPHARMRRRILGLAMSGAYARAYRYDWARPGCASPG
jgi:hypothetical protein